MGKKTADKLNEVVSKMPGVRLQKLADQLSELAKTDPTTAARYAAAHLEQSPELAKWLDPSILPKAAVAPVGPPSIAHLPDRVQKGISDAYLAQEQLTKQDAATALEETLNRMSDPNQKTYRDWTPDEATQAIKEARLASVKGGVRAGMLKETAHVPLDRVVSTSYPEKIVAAAAGTEPVTGAVGKTVKAIRDKVTQTVGTGAKTAEAVTHAPAAASTINAAENVAANVGKAATATEEVAGAGSKVLGAVGKVGKFARFLPWLNALGVAFAAKEFILDPIADSVRHRDEQSALDVMNMRDAGVRAAQEVSQQSLARSLSSQMDVQDQFGTAIDDTLRKAQMQLTPNEQQLLGQASQPYAPLPWEHYAQMR